jgi:ribosome-binding factor A
LRCTGIAMGRGSHHRRGIEGSAEVEAAGHRHARLQQILHEELSSILRDEVGDPRLDDVSLTSVVLSVDYRNARVMYVGDGEREGIERALAKAAPFMRSRLVESLDMKQVPQLRFVFDAAVHEERRASSAPLRTRRPPARAR